MKDLNEYFHFGQNNFFYTKVVIYLLTRRIRIAVPPLIISHLLEKYLVQINMQRVMNDREPADDQNPSSVAMRLDDIEITVLNTKERRNSKIASPPH